MESPANTYTSETLARRTIERRAVEAAIWGMPIVSVAAMRRAYLEDAGATYNDICYFSKPADWRFQTTTPNASSLYVYFNFNLKDGPVICDFPAAVGAGLFGTLIDAWETPLADVGPEGEDKGQGGKYLLLPPGAEQDVPAGYIPLQSSTYNGYALFRAIPESHSDDDVATAIALVKQLRLYPLSDAAHPPEQRFIDISGKTFDGIVRFDDGFYDSLARMVDEEPVQQRDKAVMGQLLSLGIEKGTPFSPDRATRDLLAAAAAESLAWFIDHFTAANTPFWPGVQWGLSISTGPKTEFSFELDDRLDIDERGMTFWIAYAAPKKLGAATFYVAALADAAGQPLQGDRTYRLRVPANVPVKQYWAVTAYDLDDGSLHQARARPRHRFLRRDCPEEPRWLGGRLVRPAGACRQGGQLDRDRPRQRLVQLLPVLRSRASRVREVVEVERHRAGNVGRDRICRFRTYHRSDRRHATPASATSITSPSRTSTGHKGAMRQSLGRMTQSAGNSGG